MKVFIGIYKYSVFIIEWVSYRNISASDIVLRFCFFFIPVKKNSHQKDSTNRGWTNGNIWYLMMFLQPEKRKSPVMGKMETIGD